MQKTLTEKKYPFNLIKWTGIVLVIFFSYLMWQIIYPYFSWRTDIDFLRTKQGVVHLKHYMGAFYLHIFSSLLVLLAGATQFSRHLMFKYPQWHRQIGKMYVGIILFISAPGALIMSYYANGNAVSRFGFSFLTIIWWLFTYWAYTSIHQRKIIIHANWMIRSYALTFSAITLRLYQFFLSYFKDYNPLNSADTYIMLSYMSWIPNLIIAEILIRNQISKKITQGKF